MKESSNQSAPGKRSHRLDDGSLHSAWVAFIRHCRDLEFGEIERLKIQDGLPVMAEVITKKVKFI